MQERFEVTLFKFLYDAKKEGEADYVLMAKKAIKDLGFAEDYETWEALMNV